MAVAGSVATGFLVLVHLPRGTRVPAILLGSARAIGGSACRRFSCGVDLGSSAQTDLEVENAHFPPIYA